MCFFTRIRDLKARGRVGVRVWVCVRAGVWCAGVEIIIKIIIIFRMILIFINIIILIIIIIIIFRIKI